MRPSRASFAHLALLVLVLSALAFSSQGQMVAPPQTVWGDIEHQPEGLEIGGVELLAGLIIALTVALGFSAFLAFRHRRLAGGGFFIEQERLRRQLTWCSLVATPVLGLTTILVAGPRHLFGVEVALLGVTLSLITVLIGTAALVVERT